MKILIAGEGFIGKAVGENLGDEHEVYFLDRSSGDFRYDITESFEIDEYFDVLIHTVGLAPGFASRQKYENVHVKGTENLLEGVDCGKIVFISALGVSEVDHSYFATKEEAEGIIIESDVDYTIVRPSTVYGEGNKLLDLIRSLAPTRIFPDLETKTQPILITDLVEIVSKTVNSYNERVLNAAGPEEFTIGRLGEKIYGEEGYSCFLVPMPEFLIQLKLLGLSFLGPPFKPENIEIVRSSNTTGENDAESIVELSRIFS